MEQYRFDLNLLDSYVHSGSFTKEKHELLDIFIYGYGHGHSLKRNFNWDNTNQNLRGLIVDKDGNVISRPFKKFFTFKKYLSENTILLAEGQTLKIPSEDFRIFEKVDGTMTVLYWVDDKPYLATQRSFKSLKAKKATQILYEKYSHTFDKLRKDRTYIFEAIYDETKVLIDYGCEEKLYLLGVIDNMTGDNLEIEDIGFPMAKEYTKEFSFIKDFRTLESLNLSNMEGLVIVYNNGIRIKIKFPWYNESHILLNKIINYHNGLYNLTQRFKKLQSISEKKLNRKLVLEYYEKGLSNEDIKKNLPDIFYSVGVEEWLNNEYKNYMNNKYDINNFENEVFDVQERLFLAESELTIWNRLKRIQDEFS